MKNETTRDSGPESVRRPKQQRWKRTMATNVVVTKKRTGKSNRPKKGQKPNKTSSDEGNLLLRQKINRQNNAVGTKVISQHTQVVLFFVRMKNSSAIEF